MHGLNRTASALRLDYYALKKRIAKPSTASTEFVELPTPWLPGGSECVIEMEDGQGARLRVQIRGTTGPDLVPLVSLLWDGK